MLNRGSPLLLLALATLGGQGARSKDKPAEDSAPTTSARPVSSSPAAAGTPVDVEARLGELAKAALTCPWNNGFTLSCDAFMKWIQAHENAGPTRGPVADAVLVKMLEDPDEKVRFLAAQSLAQSIDRASRRDAGLAKRILAVAARETKESLAIHLGDVVGQLNFAATGTLDDVKKLLHTHALVVMRYEIIALMMMENIDNDAVFDLPQELIKDSNATVRKAAVDAYRRIAQGEVRRLDDICKFLFSNIENPDQTVAALAGRNLAAVTGHTCSADYDVLLKSLETRTRAKSLEDELDYAEGLQKLCENKATTPSQKAKAAVVLKAMAGLDATKLRQVRFFSLNAMVACDPEGSKKWLQGFSNDKDDRLRQHAVDLMARPNP
jgi:hypothetical protein